MGCPGGLGPACPPHPRGLLCCCCRPPPAMISESLCGWNLICQVSDGGVSITAFVLLSCRGLQDCESSQSPAVKTRMPDDSSVEIVRWSQIQ